MDATRAKRIHLLLAAFSPSELREIAAEMSVDNDLRSELPSGDASAARIATELLDVLDRRAMSGSELVGVLTRLRPARAQEIEHAFGASAPRSAKAIMHRASVATAATVAGGAFIFVLLKAARCANPEGEDLAKSIENAPTPASPDEVPAVEGRPAYPRAPTPGDGGTTLEGVVLTAGQDANIHGTDVVVRGGILDAQGDVNIGGGSR